MRPIEKRSPPPRELVEAKAAGATRWTELQGDAKAALRRALVEDQLDLCCYCMRRIRSEALDTIAAPTGAKIEHLVARATDPGRELDWHNLLAACGGFEGSPRELQTCDTHKGNQPLTHLNPLGPLHGLKYYSDGRIDGPGDAVRTELEAVLNLNAELLRRNRVAAYDALVASLRLRLGSGKWTLPQLQRAREQLRERRPAPEFLGVLEFWLERLAHCRAP